jgi:hypothetical protein
MSSMLTKCFNPACCKELEYLRDGRVIRVVGTSPSQLFVEHFWLCGTCYTRFDFGVGPDGAIDLCLKSPRGTPSVPLPPTLSRDVPTIYPSPMERRFQTVLIEPSSAEPPHRRLVAKPRSSGS